MLWIVLGLFIGAAAAPLVHRVAGQLTGFVLALLPLGVIAWSSPFWESTAAGHSSRETYLWGPSLGVDGTFLLDGLTLVFLLLICGIGALILVYAGEYLRHEKRRGEFFAYLLFFMGSMLGLVLADNVYLLFVFWELTSISSFLLIGWNHETEEAREAARTALFVTGGGGLMLLAGLVALTQICGTADISQMSAAALRESPLALFTLIMILAGAFTKSAQFPFHFWLPGAMAAPTPVSAYLHSATMVKAGVYLLARLHPVLGGTEAWSGSVTLAGGATMLVGGLLALIQFDLKRILAYSTVSVLGTLTMLLGIGTREAITAATTYLVAHSLYKGALFLVAGSLDHEAGSRDLRQLRGLARAMPLTATASILAAASNAGVPPLFGFLGKELVYEAAWHAPTAASAVTLAAFVASTAMVVVALMVAWRPFFGGRPAAPQTPHEAPWPMVLGPLVMAGAGLLVGVSPGLLGNLLPSAAAGIYGDEVSFTLKLWHGWTPILGLSVLTLLAGVGTFRMLLKWPALGEGLGRVVFFSLQGLYDRSYDGLMRGAGAVTKVVQSGYLRSYVLIVIVTLLALLARPLLSGRQLFPSQLTELYVTEVVLAGVICIAALSVTMLVSRLAVAAILGVIGVSVMLFYVIFGALDLAVTQIMVETLTVIVLVLVLYHLPKFLRHSSYWVGVRDALVSLVFGGMIALLVIESFSLPADSGLRLFYAENSYRLAHGRNLVNVILVDFRATDTMGEVTVLTVAAVGVFSLLRFQPRRGAPQPAMVSLLLRVTTPILMFLLLVVSMYALVRGHHEPGGGFVGGLLAAAAFALHALAYNVKATRRLLRIAPHALMGSGLLVVAIAGIVGLAIGGHFLQGRWTETYLPGIGEVHLGTPLLFDLGVYLTVMGMVVTIVLTAAEE